MMCLTGPQWQSNFIDHKPNTPDTSLYSITHLKCHGVKVSRHLPMARGFTSQCVIFVPNNSDSPHIAEVMITQPNPLNLKIPKPNKMKIEKIPLC